MDLPVGGVSRLMNKLITRSAVLITFVLAIAACSKPAATERPEAETGAPGGVAQTEELSHATFVHLFEWSWPSIAQECEDFLAPAGYSAVQVSPPQEHAEGPQWWTRYQPVSYQLVSRSGNREEFVDMVERCAAVGVDIYVDAVINHMTGVYSGTGTAGSEFTEYEYPGLYGYDDFNHCGRNENDDIKDFDDVWEVHNCELVNLADLKTGDPGVQATLAAYLNDLLSVGVAGFRIDAAKHMPAEDISAVLALLDGDAFVFLEVIAGIDGPLDRNAYASVAHVTEFQYQPPLHHAFTEGDLDSLQDLGPGIGLYPSERAVVFVDNHDTQRHGDGHGFNYKLGERYVLANIFMLAWPYGYPKVMSSFDFDDRDEGGPDVEPVLAGASGCNAAWVCEHRRPAIANMVAFRKATADVPVSNWQQHGDSAISFGRGDKGHVVINASNAPLDVSIQTDLAPGDYCNIIDAASCDVPDVRVSDEGRFQAQLDPLTAIAIHRPR